jgi:hypothetical protein
MYPCRNRTFIAVIGPSFPVLIGPTTWRAITLKNTKIEVGELLYWFQVALAFVFGGFQTHHMIVNSTRGLSTSMFLFTGAFTVTNLYLSISLFRIQPSRTTKQTVGIYLLGTACYGLFLAVMMAKAEVVWDARDSYTALTVAMLATATFVYSLLRRIAVIDPIMKGVYSLIFKSVPQFIMAWKVLQFGGGGLNAVMVIVFHILTLTRIYQICRGTGNTQWNKNRIALLVAEIGNETSWSLVTMVWLIR